MLPSWGGQRQIVAFCRIFGGRQIATAITLKATTCRFFVAYLSLPHVPSSVYSPYSINIIYCVWKARKFPSCCSLCWFYVAAFWINVLTLRCEKCAVLLGWREYAGACGSWRVALWMLEMAQQLALRQVRKGAAAAHEPLNGACPNQLVQRNQHRIIF